MLTGHLIQMHGVKGSVQQFVQNEMGLSLSFNGFRLIGRCLDYSLYFLNSLLYEAFLTYMIHVKLMQVLQWSQYEEA